MEFENSFDLQAPIDETWRTLLDVERVAPCMPGAEVLGREDGAYQVAVKVKIGPMAMKYKGRVEVVEEDEAGHRAVMRANAREARGQGTAAADIVMTLAEEGATTHCAMHTDVKLSGKAAAMGQGVIRDVSAQLIAQFAENLAEMMGAGGEAAATPPAGQGAAGEPAPPEAARGPAAAGPAAAPKPPPGAQGGSLEAGALMAKVVASRLENPRTLLLVATGFGAIFLVIGFLIGRLAS